MDEVDGMLARVRADTQGFARDVAALRGALEGPLAAGADRTGAAIEASLLRAVRTGKLGFEDLKKVALATMAEIADAALKQGIAAILGGAGLGGAGRSSGGGLLAALSGLPGRATGGPVVPGRAYRVGERGPELFVPSASGRVLAAESGGGAREVRVAITINAGGGSAEAGAALARSGRQVARAVKAALEG